MHPPKCMGAHVFPSLQRSIQSCPAGQLHNSKEVGRTKTKDLSSYFLERGGCAERSEGADGVVRSAEIFRRTDHPGAPACWPSRLPSSQRRGMSPILVRLPLLVP